MKKIIIILSIIFTLGSVKSQNVSKAEYFIDNDPGYNNGINIPLTPAFQKDYNNLNFNIPVPVGNHVIFIRVLQDDGKWSIVSSTPIPGSPSPPLDAIARAEYFVNTDPGYGLGTNISIPSGQTTLPNINFNVPVASLTPGTDYLYVRAKDEKGRWSIVHKQQLDNIVTPPFPAIVKAEYFVNADPGYGLGTNITIPAGQSTLTNINFNVPVASLTAGTDYLYVRVRDESGRWSIVHTQQLDNIVTSPPPAIVKAEFFVNTDPGYGLGTNITIPSGQTSLTNINFNVPVASLTAGTDYMYVRAKDELGRWSIVHTQQLDNIIALPAPAITKAEFFVNTDPGYGLGTNITIPSGQTTLTNVNFNVPVASLTAGTDYLYVRTRDESGKWSIVHTEQIDNIVNPPVAAITKAEFFVNTDPGYGLGSNIAIPTGQTTLTNINFNVPVSSLTAGTDFLYVRTKDEMGSWSIVHTQQIDNIVAPPIAAITKAEFFVNADPGFGLGTNITIPTGQTNLNNINFNVPVASLTAGIDYLYVRARDEKGRWSITHTQQLDNIITSPAPAITKAEFFVNADPGYSLGTNITIPTGQTSLSNINFNVPVASLTGGTDFLYVRARDESGKWSIVHTQQVDNIITPPTLAITKAEFFVNTDPGYGLGNNIVIPTGQTSLTNINFNVPVASLTAGTDFLYVRAKDELGRWSIVHRQQLDNLPSTLPPQIVRAEYFIDNDPGFGSGTNIIIPGGQINLSNINFNLNLSALSLGDHLLYIRTKDENQKWSIVNITPFYRGNSHVFTKPLQDAICNVHEINLKIYSDVVFSSNQIATVFLTNSSGNLQPNLNVGSFVFNAGEIEKIISIPMPANLSLGTSYRFLTNTNLRAGVLSKEVTVIDTCLSCPLIVSSEKDNGPNTLRYIVNCAPPGAFVLFSPSIDSVILTSPLEFKKTLDLQNTAPLTLYLDMTQDGFAGASQGLLNSATSLILHSFKIHHFGNSSIKPIFRNGSAGLILDGNEILGSPKSVVSNSGAGNIQILGTVSIK